MPSTCGCSRRGRTVLRCRLCVRQRCRKLMATEALYAPRLDPEPVTDSERSELAVELERPEALDRAVTPPGGEEEAETASSNRDSLSACQQNGGVSQKRRCGGMGERPVAQGFEVALPRFRRRE